MLVTCLLLLPLFSYSQYEIPEGWGNAGTALASYNFGLDKEIRSEGVQSAYIESVDKEIEGFATLMQSCNAEPFKSKKVKMSGYVKAENVGGWAALWLRIDGAEEGEILGFDNMADRAIEGSNDWSKYEIVIEVPDNSVRIAYGALLYGTGKIWIDQISFEEVTEDTNDGSAVYNLEGPNNTGFEN